MEADLDLWQLPGTEPLGESIGQQLGAGGFFQAFDFYAKGHRTAKSESEDSGVELASGETSPPTPPGSDHSFSLDEPAAGAAHSLECLAEHWAAPSAPPAGRCEDETEWGDGGDAPQMLNAKLEQAMQRSKKHRSTAGARCGRRPTLGARRHGGSMPALNLDIQRARSLQGLGAAELGDSWKQRREARRRTLLAGLSPQEWQKSRAPEMDGKAADPLVLPGQGLRYLEHVCQVLEKMAELQRTNQNLQQEKRVLGEQRGGRKNEQELLVQAKVCAAPHPQSELRTPPRTGSKMAPSGRQRPSFRERSMSTSDVGNLWDFTVIQGNEVRPPERLPAHFVSTPDLQDTPDGWSRLKTKPMRQKSEPSQWERVKDILGKIARKAVSPMDLSATLPRAPVSRPAHSRDGVKLDDRRPVPRKAFLPNIVVKKQKRRSPPVP